MVTETENTVVLSDTGGFPGDFDPPRPELLPEPAPPVAPAPEPVPSQSADSGSGNSGNTGSAGDIGNTGDSGDFGDPDGNDLWPSAPENPGYDTDGGNADPGDRNPQEVPSGGNSGKVPSDSPGELPGGSDGGFTAVPIVEEVPDETIPEEETMSILDILDSHREAPEAVTEQPDPLPDPKPSILDSVNSNWLIGGLLIAMVLTVALILWPPKGKQGKKKR